MKTSPLSVKIL